ncbi:MAG: geranylgeranyl reductase family protein [bacterium]
MKKSDVMIVGAGPAGSWLGFRLAQAGIDSVILEKAKFPRYKACAGGLSQKTIEFLPFSIEEIIERPMAGAWAGFRGKEVPISDIGLAGAMVMRDTFDNFLAQKYCAAGGSFFDDTPVVRVEETKDGFRIESGNEVWAGKILVGADGAAGFVRRACGFEQHRDLCVALVAEMRVTKAAMEALGDFAYFDLSAVRHGYGWIFPKRTHVSIGIFTHRRDENLNTRLEDFCRTHPLLQGGEILHLQGGALPVGGYPRQVHRDRVLLVGDAAATVEPFLGEGIYHALLSADVAVDAITQYLIHGRSLSLYADKLGVVVDKNIRHARRLASLFYGHLPWTFPLLVQNRIVSRAVAREIIGKSDFGACLRYCMMRLPLLPLAYRRGKSRGEAFAPASKVERSEVEKS